MEENPLNKSSNLDWYPISSQSRISNSNIVKLTELDLDDKIASIGSFEKEKLFMFDV